MELLYVWVKEYQNFKNQGFNFNPRYHFTYNPDNNKLSLDERPDAALPAGFFGENITNVTAIVGGNGTGKTNLLASCVIEALPPRYKPLDDAKGDIYVYLDDSRFKCVHKTTTIVTAPENWVVVNECVPPLITFTYDNKSYNKLKLPYGTASYFYLGMDKPQLNLETIQAEEFYNTILFLIQAAEKNITPPFSVLPKYVKLIPKRPENNFQPFPLYPDIEQTPLTSDVIFNIFKKQKSDLDALLVSFYLYGVIINYYSLRETQPLYNEQTKQKEFIENSIKILLSNEQYSTNEQYSKEIAKSLGIDKKMYKLLDKLKKSLKKYETTNLTIPINEFKNIIDCIKEIIASLIEKQIGIPQFKQKPFVLTINTCANYQYHLNTDNIWIASSGETAWVRLFSKLSITQTHHSKIIHDNIPLLVLLDEGEIFLHPEWQRRYISDILHGLKQLFPTNPIQLIFTTHSPFLLSDIPSGNVIFLKKDATGNCQVVDNALQDNRKTFAANIHSLLADGFFMQNGLIGEFAKGKINEVIELLNNEAFFSQTDKEAKETKLAEIQFIINSIGEPFIQTRLQSLLNSKLNTDDELSQLEKQKAHLQARIDEINKNKKQ